MAASIYDFAPLSSGVGPGKSTSALARRDYGAALRKAQQADFGGSRRSSAPRVGVIYNPRSHRNQGSDFDCGLCPDIHIAQPAARAHLPRALADFAARGIDLLVINGGDGTVRDVLTCGHAVFGDNWPVLAVLPKGKTNALALDLGIPSEWTLQHAIAAYEKGVRARRQPLRVTALSSSADENTIGPVHGFILGAGAFTTATRAGQTAHRLGAFNGVAVATTALWALAQSLFGTRQNPWRKGDRMQIRLGRQGAPMAHSGQGDPQWRQVLFASTLERLPAGINPFGLLRQGLRMIAVDQISRRTTALVPAVLTGHLTRGLRERGIHQLAATQFTLELSDHFILDGEAFAPGEYRIEQGAELVFATP
ncbi:MAG: acylglycerol kinase family protein [Pseudomonadota bacterium]